MYVYVIGSDNGPQKIGIALDPEARAYNLRLAYPMPVTVQGSFELASQASARRVERIAHRTLRERRMAGEWFDVLPADAIQAVQTAIHAAQDVDHKVHVSMITGSQIRAARALIGWKQSDLAAASGVSEISIKNIERGATDPRASTLGALQAAFDRAGVIFLDPGDARDGGHGVRLKRQPTPSA